MTHRLLRRDVLRFLATVPAWLAAVPAVAAGQTHVVEMRNQNPDDPSQRMAFVPRVLLVEPGDSVRFVSVDRFHNSESIDKMNTAGGARWKGKIDEEIEVTFETPGAYAYQCRPHAAMGMVGIILVAGAGLDASVAQAKTVRQRGKAKSVWAEIWQEVDALER